ncbi:MAG: TonB-dependent receptor [Cytophagales bacterium]|nr:TonB-dependent receptor [Cytophagales bacterium]
MSTPVQRLGADELLLKQTGSLGETLSGLAGVSSSYFGNTASRPVIRGLDGDRIRIMTNGASSSDASGLSFDHAVAESPLAAESIEIVRGPAALMYGGAAIGGIVNMLDNRIAKRAQFDSAGGQLGRIQTSYATGSQASVGAALIEAGTNRLALHADAFDSKSGDVRVPLTLPCTQNGATRTHNKLCNTQADALGGALGGSMLFDHGYLGASIQNTQQNYGSPAEADVTLKMNTTRIRLEGEHRKVAAWGGLVQELSGYLVQHNYQHQEFETGTLGTSFKSKGLDAKLQAKLQSLKLNTGVVETAVGLASEHIDFVADGQEAFVPTSQTKTEALFVLQEWQAPWGKINGGVRREQAHVNSLGLAGNPSFIATERSLSATSYALGSVIHLDRAAQGLHLMLNAARSGRIPKDYELYANGEHVATKAYEQGDANLGTEKSTHIEIGLTWQGTNKTDKASLNIFRTRYDNYIYLQDTGGIRNGNPVYQFTAVPAQFQGWEWTAGKQMSTTTAIEARMSQVSAVQLATGEALPRIAPERIGADIIHKQGAWQWRGGFDHSAAQHHVSTNQQAVGSYTLWNTSLTFEQKRSTGRWLWFAKLNNATNSLAFPATSILTQTTAGRVPLPGRSLKLGLQIGF